MKGKIILTVDFFNKGSITQQLKHKIYDIFLAFWDDQNSYA